MTAPDVRLITLIRSHTVARDTMAFAFARPAGFAFKAGQSVDLTLLEPPQQDAKGARRAFSILSAPHEGELVVATRMRDTAFKRVLKGLAPGARVQLEGPFGSLTLHGDRTRPAVFLAGGIGITPFMSMIRQVVHEGTARNIVLLYGNRTAADAAFLAELQELDRRHGAFRLLTIMSERAPGWDGRQGFIDADLVRAAAPVSARPVYYVVGPPAMVAAMRALLAGMGVEDDDIRSEDFAGY